MTGYLVQHRETSVGAIVVEWPLDRSEAHCHDSGGLIIAGTDRCEPHAGEPLSCVFEWQTPGECRHPKISADELEQVRCDLCGATGAINTERWIKSTAPAAADAASYDEVVLLGDAGDDHSAAITPEVT